VELVVVARAPPSAEALLRQACKVHLLRFAAQSPLRDEV
jgi:hypothetical protein